MNILYPFALTGKYTDVTLIIIDDETEIRITVHRVILATVTYFEKLFDLSKDTTIIPLRVRNAYVCRDVIASLYEQDTNYGDLPEWQHLLELYICCDYFGIYFDLEYLDKLVVPPEGFELLLQVVEMIGYNEAMAQLLYDNLPDDYDVAAIPSTMKDLILACCSTDLVIFYRQKHICFWDLKQNAIVNRHEVGTSGPIAYSNDGTLIAMTLSPIYKLVIYDCTNYKLRLVCEMHDIDSELIINMVFSPDKTKLLVTSYEDQMRFTRCNACLDINTCEVTNLDEKMSARCHICFTQNTYIIAEAQREKVVFYDMTTCTINNIINLSEDEDIECACVSPDGTLLVLGLGSMIMIWNSVTYELMTTIDHDLDYKSKFIAITADNTTIVTFDVSLKLNTWNIATGTNFNKELDDVPSCLFLKDNDIIIITQNIYHKLDIVTLETVKLMESHEPPMWNPHYVCMCNEELKNRLTKS